LALLMLYRKHNAQTCNINAQTVAEQRFDRFTPEWNHRKAAQCGKVPNPNWLSRRVGISHGRKTCRKRGQMAVGLVI